MMNTGFLNSKRRVIFRTVAGKYAAKTTKGAMTYNPKAKFHKSPGGTERATKYVKNLMAIPSPIRPKFNRKERKNVGYNRLPYQPRKGGMVVRMKRKAHLGELFSGYKPKRAVGRPRKHAVSRGPNMGLAKLFGQKPVRKQRARKMLYKVKFGGLRI